MQQFNRILLTRMKYIGDVVLTTPIIHTLREAFPNAYIAYLGDRKAVSLLENNPYLNEIIPFDFKKNTIIEQCTIAFTLYQKKFDVVIDLFSNPRSALLSFATFAPVRVGSDVRGRGKLYTMRIKDDGKPKSAIEFHYQFLQALEIKPLYTTTEIFLTQEEKDKAKSLLQTLGIQEKKQLISIHPGATWENKKWLRKNFAELIKMLVETLAVQVIISPGPDDVELVHYLLQSYPHSVYALPLLPVRTLASVLSQCNILISNDCGPMHISVAVGTKTIGIFGPEPVEVWFPYKKEDGHIALFEKIPCSPCRTTSCSHSFYLECMERITVQKVFSAVEEQLENKKV